MTATNNIFHPLQSMVLITGGIGSGKSVVSRILRQRGYEVYDCDYEAKRIMNDNQTIISALKKRWGDEVINAVGTINNAFVASKVFNNNEDRIWLNKLVHACVRQDIAQRLSHNPQMMIECAIPMTSGVVNQCKNIWLVTAPTDIRIRRVMLRNKCSHQEVESRIASQCNEYNSLPKDYLYPINNGEKSPLLNQIDELLNTLK